MRLIGGKRNEYDAVREPPHSPEAEQAVLGGLMLDAKSLSRISDTLAEGDFYTAKHRAIYRAIVDLAARDVPFDAVTVAEYLSRAPDNFVEIEVSYIVELPNATASAANVTAYADIVAEKSKLRRLIEAGTTTASRAFDGKGASAEMIANDAARQIAAIANSNAIGGPVTIKQAAQNLVTDLYELYERDSDIIGMRSPWANLDRLTQGFVDGELEVIAGRPNMGKTIVGLNIAAHAALAGEHGMIFSLEQTERQLMRRMLSAVSSVPFRWLRAPTKTDDAEQLWKDAVAGLSRLAACGMLIDDTPGLTADQIYARAIREHLRKPLRWVVVDHLHEFELPGSENETVKLGYAARKMKALAKDLNCPLFLLAQLNRASATKDQVRRPTMADLRQSGAIEQSADNILLIHREGYYNATSHLRDVVEIAIGKGRDIEAGPVAHLVDDRTHMRFTNWDGPLPKPSEDAAPKRRSGRYSSHTMGDVSNDDED